LAYNPEVQFEWDQAKNAANLRKHGISFEDASAIFSTPDRCLEIFDETHSINEDRFIAIGPIRGGVVVVVHTECEERVVRIISVRLATEKEKSMFRACMRDSR